MRVTHPFHPLCGQEFEFVKRRRNWRQDRVYFYDGAGELVSLPAEWTDVVAADPFVVVAAGVFAQMSQLIPLILVGLSGSAEIASASSATKKCDP